MTERQGGEQRDLPFVLKCAAVLPALWVALFLLALPFPGGHPSLPGLVAMVPLGLSLTGRAMGGLTGDPGTSSVGLAVLVLATLVELAFVGAVVGVGARSLSGGHVRRRFAWLACFLIYVTGHIFSSGLLASRAATSVVLSVGSSRLKHEVLNRIARDRDRSYRGVLLTTLEKGVEPDVDEGIIAALTSLEDGGFWHSYLASPRASRWGINFRMKVLCDISNQSHYLQQAPGVDFALLSDSFVSLNKMMLERMVAELPDRPELLNPIFQVAFNIPTLGRSVIDRLVELLQRPSIATCPRIGMSYRGEWSDSSHPRHRLYELANAPCQAFTRADLELWLSNAELPEERGASPLNATGLCQFVLNTEGRDRKGRPR
jgi:hypothetical protein